MSLFTTAIFARLSKLPHFHNAVAALFFIITGAILFGPYLQAMPEGAHVWPQTDRLSLAINFYDYGFDFWYPRTSSLQSIGGITGVEFPIQPYLAALGGLLFGRESILTIFRVLDSLVTLIGFWYLFRIVFERTGNFVAGLLPGAFLMTAPTYAFYACSTLPDPFSLSLTFIGYYYWLNYFEVPNRFSCLIKSLALLILAALIKTTCGLHLGVVAGITFMYALFEPERFNTKQKIQLAGVIGTGMVLIIIFYLHNVKLNAIYQSQQFLAATMPPTEESHHAYVRVFNNTWRYEYFTITQYRVLVASVCLCLIFLYQAWKTQRILLLLLLSSLGIAVLFYQLMGAQLAIHDYYIICSFLPPVVLFLLLSLILVVPKVREGRLRYAFTIGLLLLTGYLVKSSVRQLAGRMSDVHLPASLYYTHRWMRGGADLLRRAEVPQRARILVLDDYSPNMSLVFFDRRGQTMATYNPNTKVSEIVQYMSADSLEYLIMKPDAYEKLTPEQAVLEENFATVVQQPVVVLRRRHPEQIAW